jgi:histidine ammonia-lyase
MSSSGGLSSARGKLSLARHEPGPGAVVRVGDGDLSIEDIVGLARGEATVHLSSDAAYRARLRANAQLVEDHQQAGRAIYGVTTGVGASVDNHIPTALRDQMPLNLLRFHGVGTGRLFDEAESAAIVASRLVSLGRGHSGVREELLERMCDFLNDRLLPQIPAEGSVGASGDLTPLSYLAAALVGEREVTLRGDVMSAARAHEVTGRAPIVLRPKESLAVMNGTSVMTGLACLAFERASALAALASSISAMSSEVVHGNPEHFDDRIFALKPHPGSRACAGFIRGHLESGPTKHVARLQDRYSIRCAAHVIGVLVDALDFARSLITIELNGVSDNPIFDNETGDVLHGGNFYGGHLCFAMDGIKTAVASVADLLDRQLVLLCCPETSDGLPANLVAGSEPESLVQHGFKAMQISASALTAEALKLTMPASAFSRSTESHNQDKVSMGTIAARDCLRVLELTELVAAIVLLADCQAVDLRDPAEARARTRALHECVRAEIPMVEKDRRQDLDIQAIVSLHQAGALPGIGRGESLSGSTGEGSA